MILYDNDILIKLDEKYRYKIKKLYNKDKNI